MDITTLFNKRKPVISFEIFPPKRDSDLGNIYETLTYLKELKPDFISVTFGAGGNQSGVSTIDIAHIIKQKFEIEPLIHLTCKGATKEDILQKLKQLEKYNLTNILALRGDECPGILHKGDFNYASELISFIKEQGKFDISAACYPEGHTESVSLSEDIKNLKMKVDSGATHLISQLFFDNNIFYSFLEKAYKEGIKVPIEAGIMPVVNKHQIERMVSLCGASLPLKFRKIIEKYENYPDALRDAGVAYAIDQMVDLMAQNVDGVHLYTMNNPQIAKKICNNIVNLFNIEETI